MTAPLRFLSVCSGIEAASVAWEPLGWQAAGFAEIDPFASRVLHHHYSSGRPRVMPDPGEHGLSFKESRARMAAIKAVAKLPERSNGPANFGDFTTIDTRELGEVDLLVGGTPCQAFSVAGKRLSLADARGNLSLSYAVLAHELARSHGLRWAIWENVPGVLSTDDNAFGCFLGGLVGADGPLPLPRRAERWPDVGLVAGPRARAAWRILDAQYFGLAQRRRRVFVVTGFGEGSDPAAVLFERHGLRRHPPTRGEAGEGVAGTLVASSGGCDENDAQDGRLIAYGGNNTSGPIDIATAVNAHGGPCGRQDFESETFVTHAPRGDGFDASEDGTGRGTPIVPICFNSREDCVSTGDVSGLLGSSSPQAQAIAFDTTQITHPENRSNPQPGDPCHPLAAEGHVPAVVFQDRFRGDDGRGHSRPPPMSVEITGALETVKPWCVATGWAVRRLMPVETELLQGFPDGYTAIPGAADGPRYKTHGNSMAVPVMRWIGTRIDAVNEGSRS